MLHQNSQPDYDYYFKIVLVGDFRVGKTKIIDSFVKGYRPSNIGVEYTTKTMPVENKVIKTQLWDTYGAERYKAITCAFFRKAHGALLVYDITNYQSFANVERWLDLLKSKENHADANIEVMLIGNKADLQSLRAVSQEEAASFAEKHGLGFMEISAFDDCDVEKAFEKVVTGVLFFFSGGVTLFYFENRSLSEFEAERS